MILRKHSERHVRRQKIFSFKKSGTKLGSSNLVEEPQRTNLQSTTVDPVPSSV